VNWVLLGSEIEQFDPPQVTLTTIVVAPLAANTMFSLPAVRTEDEMSKTAWPLAFGAALKVTVLPDLVTVLLALTLSSWVERSVSGVWKVELKAVLASGLVRLTVP
jgi:hypothetical protein